MMTNKQIKECLKTACELGYSDNVLRKVIKCKDKYEVGRVLLSARISNDYAKHYCCSEKSRNDKVRAIMREGGLID